MAAKLEVLICTFGEDGLDRVAAMGLPRVDGVGYLVSWQKGSRGVSVARPQGLMRDDVKVYVSPTVGLSRNRNAALSHATGDICLVADDDLRYTAAGLRAVMDAFDRRPDMDVAAFMYRSEGDAKAYPRQECDLTRRIPKGWFLTSFELAFRRCSIGSLRWNELLGIGAPVLSAGEEELLLWQMRQRGLRCRFIPETIAVHDGPTTGFRRVAEPSVLMSKGAVWRVTHPYTAPLRILLNAWRERRAGRMSFAHALRHVAAGYAYAMRNLDSQGNPRVTT